MTTYATPDPELNTSADFAIVVRALEATLDTKLPGLTEQSSLFNEVGLDSTAVLDLLLNLEDEAGITLDTDDLEMAHFATVGNLVSLISSVRSQ